MLEEATIFPTKSIKSQLHRVVSYKLSFVYKKFATFYVNEINFMASKYVHKYIKQYVFFGSETLTEAIPPVTAILM